MGVTRQPGEPRPPAPKYDRAVAMGIWVLTGLLFGLAVGILTNHGWLWLTVGLVAGIVAALWRTRPEQQIEED